MHLKNFYIIFFISILFPLSSWAASSSANNYQKIQQLYDTEIKKYQFAIKENPQDLESYWGLAQLYQYRRMYEEAIEVYQDLIKINPQHAEAFYEIGKCYQKRGWPVEEAIESFTQAVQLALDQKDTSFHFGQVYFSLGELFMQNYQYDEALESFNKAQHVDPQLPEVYYSIGLVYYYQQQLVLAKQNFLQELHLNPQHEYSHYYLGSIYHDEAVTEKAVGHFHKVLEINPNNQDGYSWLGYLYKEKKQYPVALKYYQEALKKGNQAVRYYLAEIYYSQKQYDSAIKELKILLTTTPHQIHQVYSLLADCYSAKGDIVQARQMLKAKKGYSDINLLIFCLGIFLPAILTYGICRYSIKRIQQKEEKDKIAAFHKIRQLVSKIKLFGFVILVGLYYFLQIDYWGQAYGIKGFSFLILLLSGCLMSLTTNTGFFIFDKTIRQTQASLLDYIRFSIGGLIIVLFQIIPLGFILYFIYRNPSHILLIFVLFFLLFLMMCFSPMLLLSLIKIFYSFIPTSNYKFFSKVQSLLQKEKVKIKNIFVVNTSHIKLANAFAFGLWPWYRHIFLTSYLCEILTEQELEAIFLHELAHLKKKHVNRQTLLLYICVFSLGVSFFWIRSTYSLYSFIIIFVLYCFVQRGLSKKHEKEADLYVVEHASCPEAMGTALKKLYAQNYIPDKWKAPKHPSLEKRLALIQSKLQNIAKN